MQKGTKHIKRTKDRCQCSQDASGRKYAEEKLTQYALELEFKGIELEEVNHHLSEEMNKARRLHERTLPNSLPKVEGVSFIAHYQPAQRLGGDFYNIIQSGNNLIFYLSDVMGHGLDGAMLSVFIKEAIDSYISLKPDEIDAKKILSHLNDQFLKNNYPEEYLISILLAIFNLDSYELSYSGAGFQNPLFLRLGNGECIELCVEGLPISSVIPKELMEFIIYRITIPKGSTILCFSDGLADHVVKSQVYSDRLEEVFFENSHLSLKEIKQIINEDFCNFNNGYLQGDDDITYIMLQLDPEQNT